MVTRSLHDVFVLMRNNAIRNRIISNEQQDDGESISLVVLESLEEGLSGGETRRRQSLSPICLDRIEEMQYLLTTLRMKINDLKIQYSNQLQRPSFDDQSNRKDRVASEKLVKAISNDFSKAYNLIRVLQNFCADLTHKRDIQLLNNICKSMAKSTQDLTCDYRTIQASFANELQNRHQRSKFHFESDFEPPIDFFTDFSYGSKQTTENEANLLELDDGSTKELLEHEREINKITKSVEDLKGIFNEFAFMVSDQGTVLDRIDFNIEQTENLVQEGFQQIKRAHHYKTRSRKMCFYSIVCFSLFFAFFLLLNLVMS